MKQYIYNGKLITASSKKEAIHRIVGGKNVTLDKLLSLDYKDIPKKLGLHERISVDDKDYRGTYVYIYVGDVLGNGNNQTDNYIVSHFDDKEDVCSYLIDYKKELNDLCKKYDSITKHPLTEHFEVVY